MVRGDVANSPLWASRVLGEFPRESSSALIPLAALEAARRPAVDPGGDIVVGVDPAGPGRDRSVAVACAGGAIIDTLICTASDARGPIIAFLKKWSQRLRVARIDSAGLGWYLLQSVRDAGFRTEAINVGTAAREPERFANLKAERYWCLRDVFLQSQVSGLTDDMLSELAAVNYLIDPRGRTAIEDKAQHQVCAG